MIVPTPREITAIAASVTSIWFLNGHHLDRGATSSSFLPTMSPLPRDERSVARTMCSMPSDWHTAEAARTSAGIGPFPKGYGDGVHSAGQQQGGLHQREAA